MKKQEVKFCKDCKWSEIRGFWPFRKIHHVCSHPEMVKMDTGEPFLKCITVREYSSMCGREAIHFERRP